MIKKILDLKAKHKDALILFRDRDFYKVYGRDAVKAAKILGITLTRSIRQKDENGKSLEMAGFPYYNLDAYLPKLIRAGHRIAICEEIETPKTIKKR